MYVNLKNSTSIAVAVREFVDLLISNKVPPACPSGWGDVEMLQVSECYSARRVRRFRD